MAKVAIVYFSGTGSTRVVAEAVAEGVRQAGECEVYEIVGSDINEGRWQNEEIAAALDGADGIIFGTPTYMGDVSAQLKAFFDAMAPRWYAQAWNGKVGGAFTVSAKHSGDKLNCLQSILTFAMQMGMVWVGTGIGPNLDFTPDGYYLGHGATAMAPDQVSEVDIHTAKHLGQRVAETAG